MLSRQDRQDAPEPDHGEEIYKGSGKLPGQTTLITGGDSGIGRVVAIAFAREGIDIAISYLTEEQADLGAVKGWIEKAGRWALLLPGDPEDPAPWVRDPWLFAGRRPTSTGGYARTGL